MIYLFVILVINVELISGFLSTCRVKSRGLSKLFTANTIATTLGDDESSKSSFDLDFAEAMSKPLPEWFKEQKKEQELLLKEIEDNRDRILKEFKAKYEITEEEKIAMRDKKWSELDARAARRREVPWYKKALTIGQKVVPKTENNVEGEVDDVSTKEKWQKFWDDERTDTGFYLPGFFEVFPELKLKWPKWSKNRNGKVTKCKYNDDCPFPEACCPHPFLPGDKFCCTGFGNRMLIPKYQGQEAYVRRDYNGPDMTPKSDKKPWENQE